jgi:hypothetical protein
MTEKHLADLYRLLPASEEALLSRLILGYRALRNVPLSAEQAFNFLRCRTARSLPKKLPQLKELFVRRYARVFPRGFSLTASFDGSKQYSITYSVASGTASSPGPAIVPNVFGKQGKTPSFKKLRALYEACAGECSGLSGDAEGAGAGNDDGPVVVRSRGKRPPGEPLPLIPIDMEKVEALKEETEILTKELADIFESEDACDLPPCRRAVSENGKEKEVASETELAVLPFETLPIEALPFEEEALRSLPRRCRTCVGELLERTEWNKEEFADLSRRHDLMPNALLEDLNAWSIETLGDLLLLEGKGGWTVNRELTVLKN